MVMIELAVRVGVKFRVGVKVGVAVKGSVGVKVIERSSSTTDSGVGIFRSVSN
jgi:hypothetical protein